MAAGRQLIVSGVSHDDPGMYQCQAMRGSLAAQHAAQLLLGGTSRSSIIIFSSSFPLTDSTIPFIITLLASPSFLLLVPSFLYPESASSTFYLPFLCLSFTSHILIQHYLSPLSSSLFPLLLSPLSLSRHRLFPCLSLYLPKVSFTLTLIGFFPSLPCFSPSFLPSFLPYLPPPSCLTFLPVILLSSILTSSLPSFCSLFLHLYSGTALILLTKFRFLCISADSGPVLHYRFIEQTIQPGPPVSLKCSAVGNPTPTITWTLDGLPIPQTDR